MVKEMAAEGVVEQLLDKVSDKVGPYKLVRIAGNGYFDFNGKIAKSGIREGDSVSLKASVEQFPKIRNIQKTESSEAAAAPTGGGKTSDREMAIIRLSCLRSAAMLMADSDEPIEAKQEKALAMAETMVAWITNGIGA